MVRTFEFGKNFDDYNDNSNFRLGKELDYTWDKGAGGILYNGFDTVGLFAISLDPLKDPSYRFWTISYPIQQDNEELVESENFAYNQPDFGLIGIFGGHQIAAVYNAKLRKSSIFRDSVLCAVWMPDVIPYNAAAKKKNANFQQLYLLIRRGLDKTLQKEILQFAFVLRFIAEATNSRQLLLN